MSEHRATSRRTVRRSPRRSGRVRAVLSLGIVLGLGAVSTMAFWTDTATVSTGGFVAGTLDLRVDGANEGKPAPYVANQLSALNLAPGESVAASFTVNNAGSVGFTYTATGTAAGVLGPNLRFTVRTNAVAGTIGTQAANNRVGSCTGGTLQVGPAALTGQSVIATPPTVAPGGSQTFCVVVTLDQNTPITQGGTTGTATFNLTATQVAP